MLICTYLDCLFKLNMVKLICAPKILFFVKKQPCMHHVSMT